MRQPDPTAPSSAAADLTIPPGLQDIVLTPCTDIGAVTKFYIATRPPRLPDQHRWRTRVDRHVGMEGGGVSAHEVVATVVGKEKAAEVLAALSAAGHTVSRDESRYDLSWQSDH